MEKKLKKQSLKNDEDFVLVKNINEGSHDLMESLAGKYSRRLYSFGLKICKDPSDAEDLVQDTFINMIRYLKFFRYETKFKNWLYRIAVTSCIRMRRKSRFAPLHELSLDDPDSCDSCATDTEEPLDLLITRETGHIVRKAIQSLQPEYRLVLVLRDIEGFSVEETAGITGLSKANVKVRLHRARIRVKKILLEQSELTG